MHVQHAAGAAPFVQLVDVLGDDQQLAFPCRVEPSEREVRRIGLGGHDVLAPLVVEPLHQPGIALNPAGEATSSTR